MIRSGAASMVLGLFGSVAVFGVMATVYERAWLASAVIGVMAVIALAAAVVLGLRGDTEVMQERVDRWSRRAERHGEAVGRGLASGQGGWRIERNPRSDNASKPPGDGVK